LWNARAASSSESGFGLVMEYSIYSYSKNRDVEKSYNYHNVYRGSWAGSLGGAKLGAMAGSAIGTAIAPGIGTVIGGTAGGLILGIAGAFAGDKLAEWVVDITITEE
jgi:outer membrane lipoprotein SlyB